MRTLSEDLEVVRSAFGLRPEVGATRGLRTRGRPSPGVWLAVHCQAVGHAWHGEGAGVTMGVCAFARRGIEPRQGEAVEHTLCMKNTAAEYAQLVWPRVMQAVCTAVQYVPASSRSAARLRREHRAATGIACRRQRTVRPNTSFKRTHNGMAPGPRGRLVYHRPRGPGSTPLRAA